MKDIILGLDVSTTCIGICVFENSGNQGKILTMTQIAYNTAQYKKLTGIEALVIKKRKFMEDLSIIVKPYNITSVVIEEPLLSSNNKYTVATLLRFNGMIAEGVYDLLNIAPEFISSYEAREFAFPSLTSIRYRNKKGELYPNKKIIKDIQTNKFVLFAEYPWDIDKKQVMMNKVNEVYPNIPWLLDKKGNLKKENYDANDALITCLGIKNKHQFGSFEPKAKNIEVNKDYVSCDMCFWNDQKIHIKIPLQN